MARAEIEIKLNEREFKEALEVLKKMENSIDDKWIKSTMRRKVKPIVTQMKNNTVSSRLPKMIGITTAKKKTKGGIIRVGVIKNDPSLFPDISAQGLASILEYGSDERFRQTTALGLVTGRISTGRIPQRKYAWLRQAWDRNIKNLEDEVIETATKKIERET